MAAFMNGTSVTPEEVAEQRIAAAARSGERELILAGLGLTTLPESIGKLTTLLALSLSGNRLTELPDTIGKLTALQVLDLSQNALHRLPHTLGQLSRLVTLHLSVNQLNELPETIGQLSLLESLDMAAHQLHALPASIGQLSSLRVLGLRSNRLSELPDTIGQLSKLQHLNLARNKLIRLPDAIGQLTALKNLNLNENQLSALPDTIGRLTTLKRLELAGNQLIALPDTIGQLTALQDLNLASIQLSVLPDTIGELTALRDLNLADNQLTALPEALRNLSLQVLNLHGNDALAIPPDVLGPTSRDIRLGQQKPAAPSDILAFYFRSRAEATRPLYEAKVLIVGQGGVGKSSLVDRLVRDTFDPHKRKTNGIDIERWTVPLAGSSGDIEVNIWDFGGQEVMRATHQFFLTTRSLYLVVVDARKGEDESRLPYWLKIVASFSDESPIIVVINKCEAHRIELNERGLKRENPSVKVVVSTSCETGKGIDALRSLVRDQVRALPHVADPLPVSFFDLKRDLENRVEDYLTAEQYRQACHDHGIEKREEQRGFLRYLHTLGSMLNYDDPAGPYTLRDTHVLKPEWVTDGVYRIINKEELKLGHGVLELAALGRILGDELRFPEDRHEFLIGMMRKFELCFDFPDQPGKLLIPALLSPNEPELEWPDDALRFEYHYNVLPHGLISRFIVRMHQSISERIYWETGVVLNLDSNKALVRADLQANRIFISVIGPEHTRRSALAAIRTTFREIHGSIKALDVVEKVPLPGNPTILLNYRDLVAFQDDGVTRYPVHLGDGRVVKIDIRQLLDGVAPPADREREMGKEAQFRAQERDRQGSTIFNINAPVAGNVGSVSDHARVHAEIRADNIFTGLRTVIQQDLAQDPQRDALLAKLSELEQARGTPSFKDRYQEFVALAANHVSVLAPFFPALEKLL